MDQAGDSFYSPFGKASTSRDGTNPLRPYYREALQDSTYSSAGLSPASMPSRRPDSAGGRDFRDIFSDIDYGDYIPNASPSVSDMAKRVMDEALWNYTSIVLSQPFEVAKVVLQCYDAGAGAGIQDGNFNGRKPLRREMQVRSANAF
jgi:fusion and transport protein UGO1